MLPKQRLARAENGPASPTADAHVKTGRKLKDLVTGTRAMTSLSSLQESFPEAPWQFANGIKSFC